MAGRDEALIEILRNQFLDSRDLTDDGHVFSRSFAFRANARNGQSLTNREQPPGSMISILSYENGNLSKTSRPSTGKSKEAPTPPR
jgi:hypothetical protein